MGRSARHLHRHPLRWTARARVRSQKPLNLLDRPELEGVADCPPPSPTSLVQGSVSDRELKAPQHAWRYRAWKACCALLGLYVVSAGSTAAPQGKAGLLALKQRLVERQQRLKERQAFFALKQRLVERQRHLKERQAFLL